MFYNSYSQKLLNQPDTIYGLELLPSQDKKTITIKPMVNHVEQSRITYDIYTQIDGQEELMQKNTLFGNNFAQIFLKEVKENME